MKKGSRNPMFDLDDLYKITCEEYYNYMGFDTYAPDYEGDRKSVV